MAGANHTISIDLTLSQRPIVMGAHIAEGDDFTVHARQCNGRLIDIERQDLTIHNVGYFGYEDKLGHGYSLIFSAIFCWVEILSPSL